LNPARINSKLYSRDFSENAETMAIQQAHYEEVLAECSDQLGAIALLKQFRPYLEMIPSMRRPNESVITIPLPLIRVQSSEGATPSSGRNTSREAIHLPCDVAVLMCDPEWKIKTGVEIFVFIHRPQEDFSGLLSRWRQTQICLDKNYEWMMPDRHQHILSDGSDETHPLFIIFSETPERIRRGLRGAGLPFVVQTVYPTEDELDFSSTFSSEVSGAGE
jgi:hypothetical protein